MGKTNSELVQVSNDFINDSKKIKFPKQEKKKGGPYSKNERHQRLNEVYRLHFEYGYSARKIADMMKISRNTINGDISYWFDKISKNWKYARPEGWVIKHIERLEIQRTRLRTGLDKVVSFQEKLALEKMLFEIDSKILQTQLKLVSASDRYYRAGIDFINDTLKKEGKNKKYIPLVDRFSVSNRTYEKINKLINDDKKRPLNTAFQLSGVGLQMGVTIYLGAKLGKYLDEKYPNEKNWFTIGITLFAVAISLYHLIQQVNKINK